MKRVSKQEKQILKGLQSGPKSFTQVRRFLSNIECINSGGCGIAALAMYDQAKKEGKKPKIVFAWDIFSLIFGGEMDLERHEKFKKGLVKKAPACSHVMVKIGGKYYDCNEIMSTQQFKRNFRKWDENVSRKHLVAALNNTKEWNDMFDRASNLPVINKTLGYELLAK